MKKLSKKQHKYLFNIKKSTYEFWQKSKQVSPLTEAALRKAVKKLSKYKMPKYIEIPIHPNSIIGKELKKRAKKSEKS